MPDVAASRKRQIPGLRNTRRHRRSCMYTSGSPSRSLRLRRASLRWMSCSVRQMRAGIGKLRRHTTTFVGLAGRLAISRALPDRVTCLMAIPRKIRFTLRSHGFPAEG